MAHDFYERVAEPKYWENAPKIVANTRPTPATPEPPYAFTEIMNVTFASPLDLSDTSAPESQLWEQTIKTYLDHPGTTKIWFGQLLGSIQVMKLIIDWASVEQRNAFYASQELAALLAAWSASPTPISTSPPEYYLFNEKQGYRKESFGLPDTYSQDKKTVFVAFHLPQDWEPSALDHEDELQRDARQVWDHAWSIFRTAALKSDGAQIGDKSLDGWSTGAGVRTYSWGAKTQLGPSDGERSFMGVFRFLNKATATGFVASLQDKTQTKVGDGGLETLRRIAKRGTHAEAVTMHYEST